MQFSNPVNHLLIMKNKVLADAIRLMAKDLEFNEGIPLLSKEELRHWLAAKVERMLNSQPEIFFQSLYRLDISERKAMHALYDQNEIAPNYALADLIIERELQKAESREHYRRQKENLQQLRTNDADTWD